MTEDEVTAVLNRNGQGGGSCEFVRIRVDGLEAAELLRQIERRLAGT